MVDLYQHFAVCYRHPIQLALPDRSGAEDFSGSPTWSDVLFRSEPILCVCICTSAHRSSSFPLSRSMTRCDWPPHPAGTGAHLILSVIACVLTCFAGLQAGKSNHNESSVESTGSAGGRDFAHRISRWPGWFSDRLAHSGLVCHPRFLCTKVGCSFGM